MVTVTGAGVPLWDRQAVEGAGRVAAAVQRASADEAAGAQHGVWPSPGCGQRPGEIQQLPLLQPGYGEWGLTIRLDMSMCYACLRTAIRMYMSMHYASPGTAIRMYMSMHCASPASCLQSSDPGGGGWGERVEVDVLDSPFLRVHTVSVDIMQHKAWVSEWGDGGAGCTDGTSLLKHVCICVCVTECVCVCVCVCDRVFVCV